MIKKTLMAIAATLVASTASAATLSSTGDFLEIAAPAEVGNMGEGSNTNILYFNEAQGVTLGAALMTDQGSIAAGTRVDSHMFFLNRDDNANIRLELSGTLTFATAILGTMSDINGGLLDDSDFLGAAGTNYENGFANRGLETNDTLDLIGLNTLSSTLIVTQPGDWVRVVTVSAVPVPAGIALLPLGLGGLVLLRRRRKTS